LLIFTGLGKAKTKPNKDSIERATKILDGLKTKGIKIINLYWILGRYDYSLVF
jgi:uncharacterized protein with GYD domain